MLHIDEKLGRAGMVLRVLPHGTVMIWDPAQERAYPFYKAGEENFHRRENVSFRTDKSDTVVIEVKKTGGFRRRLSDFMRDVVARAFQPHQRLQG